jgi:26S proteasome regulatory subunit T1
MPSATGQNWEKYQKKFADEEEEEKKIVPLTEEYVVLHLLYDFPASRRDGMRWIDG